MRIAAALLVLVVAGCGEDQPPEPPEVGEIRTRGLMCVDNMWPVLAFAPGQFGPTLEGHSTPTVPLPKKIPAVTAWTPNRLGGDVLLNDPTPSPEWQSTILVSAGEIRLGMWDGVMNAIVFPCTIPPG
jgi:hypothetical protein